jgi:hypothetical protein
MSKDAEERVDTQAQGTPDEMSSLVNAVPSFFKPGAIATESGDTHDDDDDDDDDDPNAELRALLAQNIKSSIITDHVAERVKECATAVSPEENAEEAVETIKEAVSGSVTEYPTAPIPDPAPNAPFDIRNQLRDLRKKGSIKS